MPAPSPGSPRGWRSSWLSCWGVMARTAPQLCCQPCWQCPSSQGGVLSSHGVFSSAGFQSLKNHTENVGQGEDQFSLISCVLGKRGLEKNASTVFSNILYSCFQCISQKEAVSCEKYITLSSYRGEKIILLLLYRSELHIHIRTTVNDVNNSIVK